MDVLGDILRVIKLKGSVYFNACFCAPWGIEMQNSNRASFHLVVDGEAWLRTGSLVKPIKLTTGDVVLFPKGTAHSISDKPDSDCIKGAKVVEAYKNGNFLFDGENEKINFICGYTEFDNSQSHSFLTNLPELIHISSELRTQFFWLDCILKQIIIETQHPKPGSDVLVDKFTEILYIQILRAYAEQNNTEQSYLSALMDDQLSQSLSLIHNNPEQDWTAERLATEVGMSRSAFYSRFNDYIGMPPMQYLFEWRMMQARNKIENTKKTIAEISEELGYASNSSFQKAFKRFYTFTPASLRKFPIN